MDLPGSSININSAKTTKVFLCFQFEILHVKLRKHANISTSRLCLAVGTLFCYGFTGIFYQYQYGNNNNKIIFMLPV